MKKKERKNQLKDCLWWMGKNRCKLTIFVPLIPFLFKRHIWTNVRAMRREITLWHPGTNCQTLSWNISIAENLAKHSLWKSRWFSVPNFHTLDLREPANPGLWIHTIALYSVFITFMMHQNVLASGKFCIMFWLSGCYFSIVTHFRYILLSNVLFLML